MSISKTKSNRKNCSAREYVGGRAWLVKCVRRSLKPQRPGHPGRNRELVKN